MEYKGNWIFPSLLPVSRQGGRGKREDGWEGSLFLPVLREAGRGMETSDGTVFHPFFANIPLMEWDTTFLEDAHPGLPANPSRWADWNIRIGYTR
jgi:hypothetical protein